MNESVLIPLLLTKKETAHLLAVCTRTVERLEADGKLKSVPMRADKRYRRRDVIRLAEKGCR